MQPHQQAVKESVRQAKAPYEKAASLLSYYVPANLAIKGLSSLNPNISKFAKLAVDSGYNQEDLVDFLREKETESKKPAKSLFMQMLGSNEPPKSLPQHLQFQIDSIQKIANKYEKEGKTIESPEVRKLTQRLNNILQGKGMLSGSDMKNSEGMGQGQKTIKNISIPDLKIGDKVITRRGERATLTHIDNETFEIKTDKGNIFSGPLDSFNFQIIGKSEPGTGHTMQPNQMAAMQGQQGIGAGQQALMQILQKIQAQRGA